MRTRSHPVSPGGLVSLDDVPPRRRITRSMSAQPQDAEPGSGAVEAAKPKPNPKTRKTRAKSTRGKKTKKTSRRPTKSAEPEQKDEASVATEEVGQDDIQMVGPPQTAISGEHGTPLITIPEGSAVETRLPADLMQDVENVVPTILETASPAQSPVANIGEPASEIDHLDRSPADLMQDVDNVMPTILETASPAQSPVANIGEPASEIDHLDPLAVEYHFLLSGFGPPVTFSEPNADQPAAEQSHEDRALQDDPISVIPSVENSYPEFITVPISRTSPLRPSKFERSQVLRPQNATPIRRSYSKISQIRRTEAYGRINRTLYRLPDLLTRNDSDGEAPPQDRHQVVETQENVAVIANPATPETARPSIPMTAPPAAHVDDPTESPNASPSWSRWIFNNVSRKWTNIRERIVPHPHPTADIQTATEAVEAVERVAASTPSSETNVDAVTAPEVTSTAALAAMLARSTHRLRRASSLSYYPRNRQPHARIPVPRRIDPDRPVAVAKPRPEPTPAPRALGYDLFPAGFDPELLKRCYARGTNPHLVQPSATDAQNVPSKSPSKGPEYVSSEDESLKLKRKLSSPETIPNPAGCSYGIDEEYFSFTEEEWEEAARKEAKKIGQPATKKRRIDTAQPKTPNNALTSMSPSKGPEYVSSENESSLKRKRSSPETIPNPAGCSYGIDEEYFSFTDEEIDEAEKLSAKRKAQHAAKKQRIDAAQPHRRATARPNTPNAPINTMSPSQRPGFVPNRRGTYAPPDLSPIDSSGLISGTESSPITQASPEQTLPAEMAPNAPEAPETTADTESDEADGVAHYPSPLTRARHKAELFKPKTPSRLREAHPFGSSFASATTASPSFFGVTTGTPSNFGTSTNNPFNLGEFASSPFYSDPMSIDSTLEPVTPGDDANWLRELCPGIDITRLRWPETVTLAETLGIDYAAAEIVNENVDALKDAEAVAAWKKMFEGFQQGELVF